MYMKWFVPCVVNLCQKEITKPVMIGRCLLENWSPAKCHRLDGGIRSLGLISKPCLIKSELV